MFITGMLWFVLDDKNKQHIVRQSGVAYHVLEVIKSDSSYINDTSDEEDE